MHSNTTPYVLKFDHHAANNAAKNDRKFKEEMWKAKKWDRLDPETIIDIYNLYNGTRESASQALNPRSAVLHRIQKYGIIPAKYTLSPRKKREIRPAWQA